MGKFKEFLDKKLKLANRKPREETVFGHGSNETSKKERKPREETVFGHGSKGSEKLSENVEPKKLEVVSIPKLTTAEHVKLHKKAEAKDMSAEHKEALNDYTDDSKDQNSTLIHFDNGHDVSGAKKEQIRRTDAALEGRHTTGDLTVYTGVKRSPARHFTKGQDSVEVHHPAYISTSTCFHMAKGFSDSQKHPNNEKMGVELDKNGEARHVLRLHVPKGTNAVSTRSHSFVPGEHEVLLGRGHDFKIHHNPTIHVDADGTKYHVWDAHVTSHYPADIDQEDL
jgi:hypothetical protein